MFKKQMFGIVVLAIAAMGVFAGSANATITPGVGTQVTAVNVTGIELGDVITCNESELFGEVTASNGPGAGGAGIIDAGGTSDGDGFRACGSGINAAGDFSPAWSLNVNVDGPDADTLDEASISGIDVTITLPFSSQCRYTGTISGDYDDDPLSSTYGEAILSGSLTRQSASGFLSGLCSSTEPVAGRYFLYETSTGTVLDVS